MTESEGMIACDCSEASVASGLIEQATANASLRMWLFSRSISTLLCTTHRGKTQTSHEDHTI